MKLADLLEVVGTEPRSSKPGFSWRETSIPRTYTASSPAGFGRGTSSSSGGLYTLAPPFRKEIARLAEIEAQEYQPL